MKAKKAQMDLRKLAIIIVSCVLAVSIVCFIILLIVLNLPNEEGIVATPDTAMTVSLSTPVSSEIATSEVMSEPSNSKEDISTPTGNLSETQTKQN